MQCTKIAFALILAGMVAWVPLGAASTPSDSAHILSGASETIGSEQCRCTPDTVANAFEGADAVFSGIITDIESIYPKKNARNTSDTTIAPEHELRLLVTHTWKGTPGKVALLHIAPSACHALASPVPQKGVHMLVYATRDVRSPRAHVFTAPPCSRTARYDRATLDKMALGRPLYTAMRCFD